MVSHHRHSCWPSRVGWTLVVFLMAYVLYMHSMWFGERESWEGRAVAALQEAMHEERAALAALRVEETTSWTRFIRDRQEDWWALHPNFYVMPPEHRRRTSR